MSLQEPSVVSLELECMERDLKDYWFAIDCGWQEDMMHEGYAAKEEMFTKAFYKLCVMVWKKKDRYIKSMSDIERMSVIPF